MKTLMNGVVLAVDRKDCDAVPRRGFGDDAAGHDEDFLVGKRDRLPQLDRGENRLQRLRAARRAQHHIRVRV